MLSAMERPKRYAKTVCVLDESTNGFCRRLGQALKRPYVVLRIGRTVQIAVAAIPPPRSYVLRIKKDGAYRIMDGQDMISVMIHPEGVEATTERWEEWEYENLTANAYAAMFGDDGLGLEGEIKVCVGRGEVEPYTRAGVVKNEMPMLPGLIPSSKGLRELRNEIREDRDTYREKLQQMARNQNIGTGRLYANTTEERVGARPAERVITFEQDDSGDEYIGEVAVAEKEVEETDIVTERYAIAMKKLFEAHGDKLSGYPLGMPSKEGKYDKKITEIRAKLVDVPIFMVDDVKRFYTYELTDDVVKVGAYCSEGTILLLPQL
uniref:Non-structural protein NS2 n=1 Tax=Heramatsu virus TaxID=1416744 RepID=U5XIV7_9REOV|nr:non-structural protein NS2 [Heramatsu virus]